MLIIIYNNSMIPTIAMMMYIMCSGIRNSSPFLCIKQCVGKKIFKPYYFFLDEQQTFGVSHLPVWSRSAGALGFCTYCWPKSYPSDASHSVESMHVPGHATNPFPNHCSFPVRMPNSISNTTSPNAAKITVVIGSPCAFEDFILCDCYAAF